MMTAEELARFFHDTYERLSGQGRSWSELGDDNKATLIAAMRVVLCKLYGEEFIQLQEQSAAEFEVYTARIEKERARLLRVCACGHLVSEHMNMPAPDGTPLLLCTHSDECGDVQFDHCLYPRCSVPAEVA
jgi:hypothetical protein